MALIGRSSVVVGVLALLCRQCVCDLNAERLSDLLQLQSAAADRVIAMDEATFPRFASDDDPRPYSLFIFFDAVMLWSNSELQLELLRKEFGLLASAYAKNNEGSDGATKVFFCTLELGNARSVFSLFGIASLPHIRFLPVGSGGPNESSEMELSGPFRSAEGMAAFLESKTKQKAGQIIRPPLISKSTILLLTSGLLVAAPFVIKMLAAQNTPLHNPQVWCIGALLVYFFSVSGGMFNIIRHMPLFVPDRNNPGSLMYFLEGSEMQLGAECLFVGLLYTAVGLILASVSHILVHLQSKNTQRWIMLLGMVVSYFAVRRVVALNNWKTGYRITSYWPKRWS
ncbi:hypothetical protein O6H91_11G096000 [Diphasiastrum complanatum]|uniref:Uncharacterized protein n=2 Tax=Diphasiastrum complanatum TaxID=34168 RepID=A0ACC2CBV0_DIPCM|nr:hypothetical protein O6H91_11G095200 [Diphasiastrum complanatum]KAJ7539489.1 hypothetical protein O6H91_11G096000 [Diphasiastrum complanatum]